MNGRCLPLPANRRKDRTIEADGIFVKNDGIVLDHLDKAIAGRQHQVGVPKRGMPIGTVVAIHRRRTRRSHREDGSAPPAQEAYAVPTCRQHRRQAVQERLDTTGGVNPPAMNSTLT